MPDTSPVERSEEMLNMKKRLEEGDDMVGSVGVAISGTVINTLIVEEVRT